MVEPGVILGRLKGRWRPGPLQPAGPGQRRVLHHRRQCGRVRRRRRGGAMRGVTRDYVLGSKWSCLPASTSRPGTRTMKGVVGYDLTRLILGSEGTLGVITRIILRLRGQTRGPPDPGRRLRDAHGRGPGREPDPHRGPRPHRPGVSWTGHPGFASGICCPSPVPPEAAALLLVAVEGHPHDVEARAAAIADFCREQGAAPVLRPGPRPRPKTSGRPARWCRRPFSRCGPTR